ncbi:SusC/RagA family TonB-linked outer membrane protein, partial [Bacteroides sp.]
MKNKRQQKKLLMKSPFREMLLLAFFLMITIAGFAQSKTVTGIVIDKTGETVIGASVLIKGTTTGVITNLDGSFTLQDVPTNGIIQVSFVGYKTVSIPVKGQSAIKVVLEEDNETLDEVVVVGYGVQKKSDLTGSVMQVKTKDITSVTANNPIQALQGRVTGVSVVTNSRPGKSPTLRIRGNGSISAGNDPLYVVDGFPLMNGSLNEINANDIASMEVLKDASATAIYGSRGSNGVIMITTKTGGKDSKTLSINANYGFQMPGRLIDTMSHEQFVDYINSAFMNSKGITVYNEENPAPNIHTDWQRESINSCKPVQDYSLSLDGTSGDTQYMLSGGIYLQDGLLPSSEFDKYTFRTNVQHKFNNFLKLGTHMQYSYTESNMADLEGAAALNGIWRDGWPTLPVYREDGSFAVPKDNPAISTLFGDGAYWNPVANYREVTNKSSVSRLLGDVYAEFQLAKGLTFKTNFGLDIANKRDYNYTTSKITTSTGYGKGGNGYTKMMSRITENILSYANTWGDHRFTATGVYSWQNYMYEDLSISGNGFINDETGAWDMGQASRETVDYGSDKYENSLISWTGRLTYAYKDRYLLTATARYDGSSRFGMNNKWGFFPSIGLAWRVSEERFLSGNKIITSLKLRGSFGVTGNQEIGNYKSLAQLKMDNYIYNDGELQGFYETIGNPDLKWERANQFDLGLDLSLLNRIHITADYYNRITSDLLYNVPIPSTSGFSTMLSNIGSVLNKGWELSI